MVPKKPSAQHKVLARHIERTTTDKKGNIVPLQKWFTRLVWDAIPQSEPETNKVVERQGWIEVKGDGSIPEEAKASFTVDPLKEQRAAIHEDIVKGDGSAWKLSQLADYANVVHAIPDGEDTPKSELLAKLYASLDAAKKPAEDAKSDEGAKSEDKPAEDKPTKPKK